MEALQAWISQIPHPSGPYIDRCSRRHRKDHILFLPINAVAIGWLSDAFSNAQVIGLQRKMPNVVVKWVATLLRFLEVAGSIICPQNQIGFKWYGGRHFINMVMNFHIPYKVRNLLTS
jgi:hypothetical protein